MAVDGPAAVLYFVQQAPPNNVDWDDGDGNNIWATTPGGTGTQSTAVSGNDYVVDGDDSSSSLRANTTSFAGDSLTVQDGGSLRINGGATRTVNLIYNSNGATDQLVDNNDAGLGGTLNVIGTGATFNLGNTSGFTISSAMSGSGNLRFRATNNNTPSFDFSGNATAGFSGILTVGQTSNNRAGIDVSFAYAISSPGFTLSLIDGTAPTDNNAQLNLDRTLAFQDVFIGGTSDFNTTEDGTSDGTAIADGIYSWADLDTLGFGDYFIDNGGTLIVGVPEPSTVALLGGGALVVGFLLLRRRFS